MVINSDLRVKLPDLLESLRNQPNIDQTGMRIATQIVPYDIPYTISVTIHTYMHVDLLIVYASAVLSCAYELIKSKVYHISPKGFNHML